MINTLEKLTVANNNYVTTHSHFSTTLLSQQLPTLYFTRCLNIFSESNRDL